MSAALREPVLAGPIESSALGGSLWSDAWRRLRRNRAAVAAGVLLLAICLLALIAPGIPGLMDPARQDLRLGAVPPSMGPCCGAGVSRSWSGWWRRW